MDSGTLILLCVFGGLIFLFLVLVTIGGCLEARDNRFKKLVGDFDGPYVVEKFETYHPLKPGKYSSQTQIEYGTDYTKTLGQWKRYGDAKDREQAEWLRTQFFKKHPGNAHVEVRIRLKEEWKSPELIKSEAKAAEVLAYREVYRQYLEDEIAKLEKENGILR